MRLRSRVKRFLLNHPLYRFGLDLRAAAKQMSNWERRTAPLSPSGTAVVAESGGGSVLNCMHAGLIPVVSYESSVDVEDFGVVLAANTIEEIRNAMRALASLPAAELAAQARRAWEFARTHHTRERFASEYRQVLRHVLNSHGKPAGPAVGPQASAAAATKGEAVRWTRFWMRRAGLTRWGRVATRLAVRGDRPL